MHKKPPVPKSNVPKNNYSVKNNISNIPGIAKYIFNKYMEKYKVTLQITYNLQLF